MPIKVQFNSSTLKASYNAGTNKVQVTQCYHAGKLSVVTSGITDANCEDVPWPENANRTFDQFVFTGETSGYCYYIDTASSAWKAQLSILKSSIHIGWYYFLLGKEWDEGDPNPESIGAFTNSEADQDSPISNNIEEEDCCGGGTLMLVGYGGIATVTIS